MAKKDYIFDESFKKQWHSLLKQKTIEFKFTPSQTRVFLTRFNYDNWLKTIEDIWQASEVNSFESFVKHSTNIYKILEDYCPESKGRQQKFTVIRDWLLAEFNPGTSLNRGIETELFIKEKQECYQAISQPGALIRIKAPSKMGKSRFLNSVLNYAQEKQYNTVHINLLQIESSKFANLDRFLRWFCIYLSDALDLNSELDNYWSQDRGSMLSCTRYLEMILSQFEQPLVLGLDEVDRLLNYPDISQDFFYLLRSWHEEANNDELWEKLRLIVVYSTEDFGSLDINQSPFNVGLPIELKSLERSQVVELAKSYNLELSETEINLLVKMLGGHPYLTDLILSSLIKSPQKNLEQILQQSTTDTGIYDSYLRQHLIKLTDNPKLSAIYLKVLKSSQPIQIDTLLAYQLYRMGLIKWSPENNAVIPRCELYKQYFMPRLTINQG